MFIWYQWPNPDVVAWVSCFMTTESWTYSISPFLETFHQITDWPKLRLIHGQGEFWKLHWVLLTWDWNWNTFLLTSSKLMTIIDRKEFIHLRLNSRNYFRGRLHGEFQLGLKTVARSAGLNHLSIIWEIQPRLKVAYILRLG